MLHHNAPPDLSASSLERSGNSGHPAPSPGGPFPLHRARPWLVRAAERLAMALAVTGFIWLTMAILAAAAYYAGGCGPC